MKKVRGEGRNIFSGEIRKLQGIITKTSEGKGGERKVTVLGEGERASQGKIFSQDARASPSTRTKKMQRKPPERQKRADGFK